MLINASWKALLVLLAACAVPLAEAAPVRLVKDVYSGSSNGTSQYLVANDAKLFFWGNDPASPTAGAPFGSDGTSAGTGVIKQIGGSSEQFWLYQPRFANNGIVYFVANDGFFGNQVWRSDGTADGTFALTSTSGGLFSDQTDFIAVGGRVIFQGGNVGQGYALMVTDGSVVGTQVLTSAAHANSPGVILNGRALFLGSNGSGSALIVSDGTPGGTSSFNVAGLNGFSGNLKTALAAVNDVVYFGGSDATHGIELWKTDGSQGGTAIVKDLFLNSGSSTPQNLKRVDDRLFFSATTPDAGKELWTSDGSDGGTARVKDIRSGLQDSTPDMLTALNGILYFVAEDGTHGIELWRTDGTEAQTSLALGDFNTVTGAFGSNYNTVQAINHKLALVLYPTGSSFATIPYVSDGTLGGTHPMDASQTATVFYSGLSAVNGRLLGSGTVQPSNIGNELIGTDAFATLGNTWCANPEQPVPDNNGSGYASHFHLPGRGGITSLTVSVDLFHQRLGDLSLKLRHEQTATEIVLLDQPAACTGKIADITFDDTAGSSAQTACASTRLAYARDGHFGPVNPLAAFNGQLLEGDWTLTAVDHAATNVGILHEWCINFATDRLFADGFD